MNKTYSTTLVSRLRQRAQILSVLAVLGTAFAANAQEGSKGNTTIFGGAQMTFFGNHSFVLPTASVGTQPGVILTERATATISYLNFFGNGLSSTGASDANYVDGYVRKYGTGQFIFPVGDNGNVAQFAASADGTSGAYFHVNPTTAVTTNLFTAGNYPVLPAGGPFNAATKAAAVQSVSTVEYWDIDGATTTPITLTWDAGSNVAAITGSALSKLTIVGWSPVTNQWEAINSVVDATSILTGTSSLTAGSITSSSIVPNTYTAYTLASKLFSPQPDVNVTYINVPVPGNVNTNDKVPAGTTYGTPVPDPANPTGATITMNPDGTYTFTGTTPGKFTYSVPVCSTAQPAVCVDVPLVITVLPSIQIQPTPVIPSPPVANTDITTVKGDPATPVSVTVDVRSNDKPSYPGGTLNPPTITVPPTHGTATVTPEGNIKYVPTPGYYGIDILTYQVCESPSGLCTTATEVITVLPPDAPNSTIAADDYVTTPAGVPATGNVKTNDTDPEGNTQTITAQTVTNAKGTLVLNTDGTYTFTPATGVTGPVSFPYTTCDSGTPQACATATLYVLVAPAAIPNLTPTIDIDELSFTTGANRDFIVNIFEINGFAASGSIQVRIPKLSGFTITYPTASGSSNVFGGTTNENSNWTFTQNTAFIIATAKTGVSIAANGTAVLGFHIARNAATPGNTTQYISPAIVGGSGGETKTDDNAAIAALTAIK